MITNNEFNIKATGRIAVITEKQVEQAHNNHLALYSGFMMDKSKAIERMAKAMCSSDGESCKQCAVKNNKHACKSVLHDELFMQYAQSALNALLEEATK